MGLTRVAIDLNVRTRGNGTFSGLEDVTGPLAVGMSVQVYEPETGLSGPGRVTDIDLDRQLVYLAVDWAELQYRADRSDPTDDLIQATVAGLGQALTLTYATRMEAIVTSGVREPYLGQSAHQAPGRLRLVAASA